MRAAIHARFSTRARTAERIPRAVLACSLMLSACGQAPSPVSTPPAVASAKPAAACIAVDGAAVWIPGGRFEMGSERAYAEEGPVRPVTVAGFWLERHEVTNAQFAQFVDATGYVTVAERPVDAAAFPGAPADMLLPGSAVFTPPPANAPAELDWWSYVPGAYWRKPQGPAGPDARADDPVVHVAFEDAQRYARWRGGRLPREAEWEYAARGGQPPSMRQPDSANTWQGAFPFFNSGDDGYPGLAPVGCFAANAYGLYDMIGNVWEWTGDRYASQAQITPGNPGTRATAADAPVAIIKGGSYLCSPDYCRRYRVTARSGQDVGLGTSHIGLRLAFDRPPPPKSG